VISVHNPGALPEPQYFNGVSSQQPDLTVIFEDSFSNWTLKSEELSEATEQYDGDSLALLMHSTPDLTIVETNRLVLQLLAVGRSMWLTASSDYRGLDGVLPMFIDCLDALLS
jgi:hypothetical protein